MSKTFLLDDNYDLVIQNNNFVLDDGIDALKDRLKTNLRTFKGEWYLDPNLGIPYFQSVFRKGTNVGALYSIFRPVIGNTVGVRSVNKLTFDKDNATRELTISFNVTADNGTILEETISLGV